MDEIGHQISPEVKGAWLDIFCPDCKQVHAHNDFDSIVGITREVPRLPGGLGWHPTVGSIIVTCENCLTKFWKYIINEEDYAKILQTLSNRNKTE